VSTKSRTLIAQSCRVYVDGSAVQSSEHRKKKFIFRMKVSKYELHRYKMIVANEDALREKTGVEKLL